MKFPLPFPLEMFSRMVLRWTESFLKDAHLGYCQKKDRSQPAYVERIISLF